MPRKGCKLVFTIKLTPPWNAGLATEKHYFQDLRISQEYQIDKIIIIRYWAIYKKRHYDI